MDVAGTLTPRARYLLVRYLIGDPLGQAGTGDQAPRHQRRAAAGGLAEAYL
jgi:hypothetical protein